MIMMKSAAIGRVTFALLLMSPAAVNAQAIQAQSRMPPGTGQAEAGRVHRVVVQLSQNDPAVMNMALNNVENLVKFFQDKGEAVEVEFVAYGAGLNIFRADTSPVKDRLTAISATMKNVTFSGCGNTLANQSRMENKEISLIPEARIVPTGIARIVELEEQGWTYVRP